ncbi:M20 family metallo-hydrolase [Rubeoparvulum massiliense]|uniref:M20 family metallo-hydrolase n=1 Tax=Rubeoparvulum massiliense TaxID=1631346 RepID=UPI00065DBF96|nr:M20 family metallo-hydrolase [Rubeoparvulum massiliense]
MNIEKDRLYNDLEQIAQFGKLPQGGVTRLALSTMDMHARTYLIDAMKQANLDVRIDAVGNIYGRREGKQNLPPVLLGSHLDTVPEGGNYDGIVGVSSALEVIRTLNDADIITERPIEIINFTAEESSRFRASTIGSKALKGVITSEKMHKMVDKEGISFYQALKNAGYHPDQLESVQLAPGAYHAFLELHIEQGPVLERLNKKIGIVTAIAAPTRMHITIEGKADHSGNTPMNMRQDALAGACEVILAIEEIAKAKAGEHTVGTVGDVSVKPGAMNVIPGEAQLWVDIRDIDYESKKKAVHLTLEKLDEVAQRRKLAIKYEMLSDEVPVQLSPRVIQSIQAVTEKLNFPYHVMHSGAGHDAMNLVPITDVGMIFVPSKDGISHNIAEFTSIEDIALGANVLLHTVYQLSMEGE